VAARDVEALPEVLGSLGILAIGAWALARYGHAWFDEINKRAKVRLSYATLLRELQRDLTARPNHANLRRGGALLFPLPQIAAYRPH
jgi:hypothetical protein